MHPFATVREQLLEETKHAIAASVNADVLITTAVTTLEQLEQNTNGLVKKAREWFALANPEQERATQDHEAFLRASHESQETVMGGLMSDDDRAVLRSYLDALESLYKTLEHIRSYVERLMTAHCPNVTALAGATIGAKLLSHAGSLQRLSSVPSSTLQLYGAEMALFRHLRDKQRHKSPKYGVIFNHPLVQRVPARERGKAARTLADKLSICAKVDYFKGEPVAAGLRDALVAKFGAW